MNLYLDLYYVAYIGTVALVFAFMDVGDKGTSNSKDNHHLCNRQEQ